MAITEKFTHAEKFNICLAIQAQVQELDASLAKIATSEENLSGHSLQAQAYRAVEAKRNDWDALRLKVYAVLVQGA